MDPGLTVPTSSCDGACCVAFPLHARHGTFEAGAVREGAYIADMIRPIGYDEARERFAAHGFAMPDHPMWGREETQDRLYTCRHWDPETHRCDDYENRPGMCSAYPYGAECLFGCGYQVPESVSRPFNRNTDRPGALDWKWPGWRWRRGRYRAPATFARPDDWDPAGWSWDPVRRTLAPDPRIVSHRWNPRRREWVAVEVVPDDPAPEEPS